MSNEQLIKQRTRRAFLGLAGGAVAGATAWQWIWSTPMEDELPSAVRRVLDFNGRVAGNVLYKPTHLAPEFPPNRVGLLRANGDIGMTDAQPEDDTWAIAMGNAKLPLTQIRALPKHQQITEFKCIEGWSAVARWGGARFRDFAERFAPDAARFAYAGLTTPDGEYSVGVDMASMMHPQTLLAWEMNGQPLTKAHGAPLRLVIPVKYGIKNIKRIGAIAFAPEPPADYWAKDGYDYYAGL